MPIALAIPVATAVIKASGLLIGSIFHEVSKHFRNNSEVSSAKALLFIEDEYPPHLEDASEAPLSSAMVVYESRSIIPSSSSRVLVNLNRSLVNIWSQLESLPGEVFATPMLGFGFRELMLMDSSNASHDLKRLVGWYLGRIIDMTQSAFRSFEADWKEMISGSGSGSFVEKKAITSISTLLQIRLSSFLSTAVVIVKEAPILLMKREQERFKIVATPFPTSTEVPLSDMIEGDHNVEESDIAVEVGKRWLSSFLMLIAQVKHILSMVFVSLDSLLDPFRRGSIKVSALICAMLLVGAIVGWIIPLVLVIGGCEESILTREIISLDTTGLASSIATPGFTSLQSGIISNEMVSFASRNLDDLLSLSVNSHEGEGPVGTDFDTNCSLSLPHWLDCLLWNGSISQSDTAVETLSQFTWDDVKTSPSHHLSHAHARFANVNEQGYDETISSVRIAAELHTSTEIEPFDSRALIVIVHSSMGLLQWPDGEVSIDSHVSSSDIVVHQSHTEVKAVVQFRHSGPSQWTRNGCNCEWSRFAFTVRQNRNKLLSFELIATEQSSLTEVDAFDKAALEDLQHSWMKVEGLGDSWTHIHHAIDSLFIAMVDLDEGASYSRRVATKHSVLVVAEVFGIYIAAFSVEDGSLFIAHVAQPLEKAIDDSNLKHASDCTRSSITLLIADYEQAQEHSEISYPSRELLCIEKPSCSPIGLVSVSVSVSASDQLMSQVILIWPVDVLSRDLSQPQLGVSLSTLSETNHLKLEYSFEVVQAGISSMIFDSCYLAWVILLLMWNNCDGNFLSETEMVSNSETSIDFSATDEDAIFADEWNEPEERRHSLKWKRSSTASKALHSDLGRHWKSPSKRRRRKSTRSRSKPKYYEPM